MAKPKYLEWLQPHRLEQISNWAAKGCTNAEIARNMGIHRDTLRVWEEQHAAISDAVKKGRAMSIVAIENAAFKLATGQAEETQLVKVRMPDGSERIEQRGRRLPPDKTMLIFLLKNRCGYSDNPNATPNESSAPKFYFDPKEGK